MAKKHIAKESLSRGEDWYGNNAAVRCPVCAKVFIVSGFLNKGRRQCPICQRTTAEITSEALTLDFPNHQEIPTVLTRAELERTGRLEEFVNLVAEGGAIGTQSLKQKLPKAERVAILEREGKVVAVAAKKNPLPDYVHDISQKSGYRLQEDSPELGYVAVSNSHRGQGLSSTVVRRILIEFGNATVFATTSDKTMKLVLGHNGFEWVGHEWDSIERPGEKLSLWIKKGRH